MLDERKTSGINMRIKAVLLDFGGTLVQTPPQFDYETCLVHLHQTLLKNGISVSYEDYRRFHIEIRDRVYARNSLKEVLFGSRISEALSSLGYFFKPTDKIVKETTDAFMEPWIQARTVEKHVPSTLQRLKKKYKLGVVSNFGHSPTVRITLERLGLVKFFDSVVVSADVGWRKPSPRIFQRALKALMVSASESVFVGDELDHDIEGAKKVGMLTILLRKPSTEETRYKVEPDETICGLKELPRALESLEAMDANNPKRGHQAK